MIKQLVLGIVRAIVGGLFIFSGLIKINDPVGTAIKLEEYFDVFSYDIAPFFEVLKGIALPLAVFLVVAEVVLGVMILVGWRIKIAVYLLLVMIVFFTFLTFYSAYFNKVTDCGCFGDAIKLTPWESFYKDIFLLVLIGVLFLNRKDLVANTATWGMVSVLASLLAGLVLSVTAIRNLPFIDFRAFKVGVNIPQAMQPSGQLEYAYVMKKGEEIVTFDQYPADDGYEFLEMNLKNPEALPKITDFAVWNEEGDFTEDILQGQKLLILVSNLQKMSSANLDEISALIHDAGRVGLEVKFVCASSEEEIQRLLREKSWNIGYYLADATVVKTIIRANPGLVLLDEGTVVAKYHHNNTPEIEEVVRLLLR
ncbi:MAG: DoxX family protein [Lunatimonas sp.]|uniref:BT_3928 family protein n=1 Tax=Lunatimonas sp. TaxID=2060141 RepID=UPI00263A6313|nr:BT_3928 family protein [Lunatimonas sp.]MCC5936022.1 DoxX family protein [Lunatimonas sp.]